MTTIVTTDFGAIHDALNRLIINEVKVALRLVPERKIEGGSLCRIVVSDSADYEPVDGSVHRAWLDQDNKLNFYVETGGISGHFTEDDDMLDITDFHYLIEQLKEQMPDGRHVLINYDDMQALASAAVGSMLEY